MLDEIILWPAEMQPNGMCACHSSWVLFLREPVCLTSAIRADAQKDVIAFAQHLCLSICVLNPSFSLFLSTRTSRKTSPLYSVYVLHLGRHSHTRTKRFNAWTLVQCNVTLPPSGATPNHPTLSESRESQRVREIYDTVFRFRALNLTLGWECKCLETNGSQHHDLASLIQVQLFARAQARNCRGTWPN